MNKFLSALLSYYHLSEYEYLELTKEYSNLDDDKQVKFNNRLLDNICQGMKNE